MKWDSLMIYCSRKIKSSFMTPSTNFFWCVHWKDFKLQLPSECSLNCPWFSQILKENLSTQDAPRTPLPHLSCLLQYIPDVKIDQNLNILYETTNSGFSVWWLKLYSISKWNLHANHTIYKAIMSRISYNMSRAVKVPGISQLFSERRSKRNSFYRRYKCDSLLLFPLSL